MTEVERKALTEAAGKIPVSRSALTRGLGKITVGGPVRVIRMKFGRDGEEDPVDRRARLHTERIARLEHCVGELKAATTADEQRLIWEEINDLCFLALDKANEAIRTSPR